MTPVKVDLSNKLTHPDELFAVGVCCFLALGEYVDEDGERDVEHQGGIVLTTRLTAQLGQEFERLCLTVLDPLGLVILANLDRDLSPVKQVGVGTELDGVGPAATGDLQRVG